MPSFARISATEIDLAAHVAAVADPSHGAVATFIGLVRDHDPAVDGTVTHLEYSAHPDADRVIAQIVADVEARFGAAIALSHRTGLLSVGEPAIVAAAAAAHRAAAFDACHAAVERVKAELPIWKREILADGSHSWVGIS